MNLPKFPVVLVLLTLFFSCNDDYRGISRSRPQVIIPRESMRYDSGFLLPPYDNTNTATQNTALSQPFTSQADPLAAQALAQTQINTIQPFDTAAVLLAKGLNPPHGYPGHSCDLKVGEPLNSKPELKTTKQALNPAHGQPGHRCDIAVGAPLNSKPVINTVQNLQTNNPTSEIMALKDGINPAHGQPGHRCDIAVGAPLNSKPVTTTNPADQNIPVPTNITSDKKVDSLKN
jgi:hypothetical protein